MTTLYEPAYAKVNLTLDVLGKREDGYHELESVMQTISLHDDIELDVGTGKPWKLLCDQNGVPCDERNLAWKAAKLYCDSLCVDPEGLEIRIRKRIPSEAGMAGGSADAAAVLRALNRHFGDKLTLVELADLGARVGSDVPFCVLGGTVMCRGRGERMEPLKAMPQCIFVVAKPEFSVSTPMLFRKIDSVEIYDRPDNRAMDQALEAGDLGRICDLVFNVFDPVVSAEHPEVGHIKEVFARHGARGGQMTGSGSACFAIVTDMASAEALCEELKQYYPFTAIATPI